jgi:hypothetical protein
MRNKAHEGAPMGEQNLHRFKAESGTGELMRGSFCEGANDDRRYLIGQGLGTFSSFEWSFRQVHAVTKDHRMTKAPELPKTATSQPAPVSAPPFQAEGNFESPKIICDIADGNAFVEEYRKPHIPVMSAFGGGRLHVCRFYGSWDLDRMITENGDALFRSIRKLSSKSTKDATKEWDDLTFKFGPRAFLYADKDRMIGFAATSDEAERLVADFAKKYHKPKPAIESGGVFFLLQFEGETIRTREVSLSSNTILKPETLNLHYGTGSGEWHQSYVERLHKCPSGLTIFEGRPGTGKTFYLRHLMGELKESHRFYFIPTASMGALSKPEFIGFWSDQRQYHSDKRFVIVLEDSDGALMTRGTDNREQVSALLNLSDGMLGDFLRLQIICTINCSASDIDPALLRPGRLLCHRVFGRLDYAQAARLAESLGRKLPQVQDYSLAEVFAGHDADEIKHQRIGFAA